MPPEMKSSVERIEASHDIMEAMSALIAKALAGNVRRVGESMSIIVDEVLIGPAELEDEALIDSGWEICVKRIL